MEPVRKAPVRPPRGLPRRASSRVKGEPAPEPGLLATAGAKKGLRAPNGGESAAAGAARASGADVLPDEDEEASFDREDDDEDKSVAGGGLALLASGAAAINENDEKNQHSSGVWGTRSPTGLLLAKERVAKMDHKDEKPWEVTRGNGRNRLTTTSIKGTTPRLAHSRTPSRRACPSTCPFNELAGGKRSCGTSRYSRRTWATVRAMRPRMMPTDTSHAQHSGGCPFAGSWHTAVRSTQRTSAAWLVARRRRGVQQTSLNCTTITWRPKLEWRCGVVWLQALSRAGAGMYHHHGR